MFKIQTCDMNERLFLILENEKVLVRWRFRQNANTLKHSTFGAAFTIASSRQCAEALPSMMMAQIFISVLLVYRTSGTLIEVQTSNKFCKSLDLLPFRTTLAISWCLG